MLFERAREDGLGHDAAFHEDLPDQLPGLRLVGERAVDLVVRDMPLADENLPDRHFPLGDALLGALLALPVDRRTKTGAEAALRQELTRLFGEAATGQMNDLAQLTGGRTFDARTQSLAVVFKEIRGYQ